MTGGDMHRRVGAPRSRSSPGTLPPAAAARPGRLPGRRGSRVWSQLSTRSLLIAATVVIVALLGVAGIAQLTAPAAGRPPVSTSATPSSGLPTVPVAALPPQARSVLALVDKGGPFQYRQDGTVFSNVEGLLPARPSGYYREYTVVTPGSPDRGTRRLVVGRDGDVYYTSDHYASFRQVLR